VSGHRTSNLDHDDKFRLPDYDTKMVGYLYYALREVYEDYIQSIVVQSGLSLKQCSEITSNWLKKNDTS